MILIQVGGLLVLQVLVVLLHEVQHFEGMTVWAGFIEQPGIVAKPTEHLFSGRQVHTLEALAELSDMQRIVLQVFLFFTA